MVMKLDQPFSHWCCTCGAGQARSPIGCKQPRLATETWRFDCAAQPVCHNRRWGLSAVQFTPSTKWCPQCCVDAPCESRQASKESYCQVASRVHSKPNLRDKQPCAYTTIRAVGTVTADGRSRTRLLVRAAAAADDSKRAAAEAAVDKYVTSNSAVAFGNGELVNQAIAYLGSCLMNKKLENVIAVPVSSAAAHEAAYHGVPLTTVEEAKQVSLLLDQADQYDESANAALKGIRAEPQQPELPRLRQALSCVQKVVLLAESQDVVPQLCASLPVFIDGGQWEEPAEALDDLFLGDAEIWRRPAAGVANPRGGDNPYVSPGGHNIVDVRFYEGMKLFGEDAKYDQIAQEIEQIEGVITHGLLLGVADAVVVADPQQGVRVLEHQAAAGPSSS